MTSDGLRLSKLIAPSFHELHRAIKAGGIEEGGVFVPKRHFWLCGGRGSTKSSFAAIQTVLAVKRDPTHNAVVIRKVANTMRDSVFAQVLWAIEMLGCGHEFHASLSPMEIRHASGTRIVFRGADDADKIKSLKFRQGYASVVWLEEADQFTGMREVRTLLQSLVRGGEKFTILYSYNPPRHRGAWVNKEETIHRDDRIVHRSCYTDVPREWLGEVFFQEAEMLREIDEKSYRHEYLGEPVGIGGVVFDNVSIETITDEQIAEFDRIYHGVDWGFDPDPFVYGKMHFDRKHSTLYIFEEFSGKRLSNEKSAAEVKKRAGHSLVMCDSAEPKSIADMRALGVDARPAKKGPGSVEYGMKWLQSLKRIVIDPKRAPVCASEFPAYEYVRSRDGDYTSAFPDKDNHGIDMVRYAMQPAMNDRSARISTDD
jgi:PBSX family phage terminase large subunit